MVQPGGAGLGLYRNLGNFYFDGNWSDSGLPKAFPGASQVMTEDWNNEGLPGVFIARADAPPAFYAKKRAAAFTASNLTQGWPAGAVMATGDLDNDLRPEAVIATATTLEIINRDQSRRLSLPLNGFQVSGLLLADYDNDGWLDLFAYGSDGVRVWRNAGHAGFTDVTEELGLDHVGPVDGMVAADFERRRRPSTW